MPASQLPLETRGPPGAHEVAALLQQLDDELRALPEGRGGGAHLEEGERAGEDPSGSRSAAGAPPGRRAHARSAPERGGAPAGPPKAKAQTPVQRTIARLLVRLAAFGMIRPELVLTEGAADPSATAANSDPSGAAQPRLAAAEAATGSGSPVADEGRARAPLLDSHGRVVGALSVDRPAASDPRDPRWDPALLAHLGRMLGERLARLLDEEEAAGSPGADAEEAALPAELTGPLGIIGASHRMREVFALIRQVAGFDTPVLLRGESGTGKELVAQAIHQSSARAEGPFVGVNCGALPESLVESELFGHARGAYTGAVQARRGRFVMAHEGTLFLDEIGELPLAMQVKLLRALQSGEIHPVGEEMGRRVDVRVIAATNVDLEKAIRDGRFREDLYYRLNVFPIVLPSLRERRTDITLLADAFVERYSRLHHKNVTRISTPAIELMMAYHWPGNVRELENCIARAVLLTPDGVIRAQHLPPTLQTGASSGTSQSGSLDELMTAYEREILIEAMKDAGGNMTRAAQRLMTTPRILAYRLRRLGLHDSLARLRKPPR